MHVFDGEGERLLGTSRHGGPVDHLMNVNRAPEPVFGAVVAHLLLRDPWWCGRLVPEVDPVDRLIDLPLDVEWIDALDVHVFTLGPLPHANPLIGLERML